MLNPVAMSIITNTFTEPRERAQAVGVWGAVFGISMALGPIVGGALVSSVGWRSIFWINIPIGLAAIVLTLRFIPESRAPRPRRFDPVGQVAGDRAAGGADLRHHRGARARAGPRRSIVAAFAASAAALLALLLYEPRREEPLIDLRFFRSIPFASSIAISVAAFAAFGGFLFLNTLYLQEVRGLSPVAGRARDRADGADDGASRRRSRAASSAAAARACRSRSPASCLVTACAMLTGLEPDDAARAAARGVRRLRARLRVRQRADHERRRVRDAARAGGRRRRRSPRRRGRSARRSAWRSSARSSPRAAGRRAVVGEPPGLVDAHRLRRRRARARLPGHDQPRAASRPGARRPQLNPEALAA